MSKINVFRTLGILFVSSLCLMACSPEEYGPCTIPTTTAHRVACEVPKDGDEKTATCAADYTFDCDSLICGIYQSSEPFCTHRCLPKKSECTSSKGCTAKELDSTGLSYKTECPDGAACVEWIKGTSRYYCLPADKGKDNSGKAATKPAATEEDEDE